jgi:hypothetical protein
MEERWRAGIGILVAIFVGILAARGGDVIPTAKNEHVLLAAILLLGLSFTLLYSPPLKVIGAMFAAYALVFGISRTSWYQQLPLWLLALPVIMMWAFLLYLMRRRSK